MSDQPYTAAQQARIDREARELLADGHVGGVIRRGCGAQPTSRRQRWHDAGALVAIGRRAPLLRQIIVHACAIAWQQRLDAITADAPNNTAIRSVAQLLVEIHRDGAP